MKLDDINIEDLKKIKGLLEQYQSSDIPTNRTDYLLSIKNMPDDISDEIKSILSQHLSQARIDEVFGMDKIESSSRTTARFLTKLLGAANISSSEIEKESGLSHKNIDRARNEERPLPKTTLMGLCLIFQMDMEDVNASFAATNNSLCDDIPDNVFRSFIQDRNYNLADYVAAVRDTTFAAQKVDKSIKLDKFFMRDYHNFNRPLMTKAALLTE